MNANSYSGMYSNRLNSSMNYMNPSSYYKNAGQEINPNANVTSGISCRYDKLLIILAPRKRKSM